MSNPITICTGFEEIIWRHLNLRKSNIEKGKAIYDGGHIINVKEKRKPGEITEITGNCIRQTSVTERAYALFLKLDDQRKVIDIQCQCDEGTNGHCKHAAGFFFYINNERHESKTDQSCRFIEPSVAGKSKYPRGEELEVMARIPEKYKCPKVTFDLPSDEEKKRLKGLMEKHGNQSSPLYKLCSLKVQPSASDEQEEKLLPKWIFDSVFQLMPDTHLQNPKNERQRVMYEENILISREEAFKLCSLTIDQAKNPLWHRHRKNRITASKAHSIIRAQKDHTRIKAFEGSLSGDIPALKFGRDMEGPARDLFKYETDFEVLEVGLVVKQNFSWLAASPDGLIRNKVRPGHGILEIKSIYSKHSDSDPMPLTELKCLDENDQLMKTNPWYCQIQITAFVTNAKYAVLFLYNGVDFKIVEVPIDADWV